MRTFTLPSRNPKPHYFKNRDEVGRLLAQELAYLAGNHIVVAGLARGGVPIAARIARKLRAPLDIMLVRKIGHPYNPEFAIGALAEGQEPVLAQDKLITLNHHWLNQILTIARQENESRQAFYFGDSHTPRPDWTGALVILVDDGMATGYSMYAAALAARARGAAQVIVAVPVASADSIQLVQKTVDELVVLTDPSTFLGSVGSHYIHFEQVRDSLIKQLLQDSLRSTRTPASSSS